MAELETHRRKFSLPETGWLLLLLMNGALLFWGLDKGFEFNDEAFALLNYRWPNDYHHFGTFFQLIVDRILGGQSYSILIYRGLAAALRTVATLGFALGFRAWVLAALPREYAHERWFLRMPFLLALLIVADWFAFTRYQMTLTYYTLNQACLYLGAGALLYFLAGQDRIIHESGLSASENAAEPKAPLWPLLGAGALAGLLLFIKFPSSIAFVMAVLLVLIIHGFMFRRSLGKSLLGFACGVAGGMALFFLTVLDAPSWWREFSEQLAYTASRSSYGAKHMINKTLSSYIKILKWTVGPFAPPLLLAAAGCWLIPRKMPWVSEKALAIWVTAIMLVLGWMSWQTGFFWRPMIFLWSLLLVVLLVRLLAFANESCPSLLRERRGLYPLLMVLFLGGLNLVGIAGSASAVSTSFTAYMAPPVAGVLLLIAMLPSRLLQSVFAVLLLLAVQGAWAPMFAVQGHRYLDARSLQVERIQDIPNLKGVYLDAARAAFLRDIYSHLESAHGGRFAEPKDPATSLGQHSPSQNPVAVRTKRPVVVGLTDMPGVVYAVDGFAPEAISDAWISVDVEHPEPYCRLLEKFTAQMKSDPARHWFVLLGDKLPPEAKPCTEAFLAPFSPFHKVYDPARKQWVELYAQKPLNAGRT